MANMRVGRILCQGKQRWVIFMKDNKIVAGPPVEVLPICFHSAVVNSAQTERLLGYIANNPPS